MLCRRRSEFALSHYGLKAISDMSREELATALVDMCWRYDLLNAAKMSATLKPIETTVETGQAILEALFADPTQSSDPAIHP